MEPTVMYALIALGIFFLFIFIFVSYVKAPPSFAYIISGIWKEPKVLIGTGGFRIPFFQRLDRVYLGQITVDIKTEESVPTNDFINVDVDAVAKVQVLPDKDGTRLAAKNFLNMTPDEIATQLQDSLQGNMREIIGTLDLRSLNTDRDGFSDQVMQKATPDMAKLGINIISCNIQNVTDREGLIKDLGADNTAKIKKDAAINRAIAERDVKIEVSKADKDSNDARVDADTAIAIKNNDLALKRAALKLQADTAQADADAAYAIQQQEQQKTINIKTVEAEIEKTKREQVLSKERIEIKQNELAAEIEKKADAEKYKQQQMADVELYKLTALVGFKRHGAYKNIKLFALDYFRRLSFHLACAEVRKQVRDYKLRLAFFFTDIDAYSRSVFFNDNAVKRKRNGDPLVFFDSAVVVRFEKSDLIIFIKRVGL